MRTQTKLSKDTFKVFDHGRFAIFIFKFTRVPVEMMECSTENQQYPRNTIMKMKFNP